MNKKRMLFLADNLITKLNARKKKNDLPHDKSKWYVILKFKALGNSTKEQEKAMNFVNLFTMTKGKDQTFRIITQGIKALTAQSTILLLQMQICDRVHVEVDINKLTSQHSSDNEIVIYKILALLAKKDELDPNITYDITKIATSMKPVVLNSFIYAGSQVVKTILKHIKFAFTPEEKTLERKHPTVIRFVRRILSRIKIMAWDLPCYVFNWICSVITSPLILFFGKMCATTTMCYDDNITRNSCLKGYTSEMKTQIVIATLWFHQTLSKKTKKSKAIVISQQNEVIDRSPSKQISLMGKDDVRKFDKFVTRFLLAPKFGGCLSMLPSNVILFISFMLHFFWTRVYKFKDEFGPEVQPIMDNKLVSIDWIEKSIAHVLVLLVLKGTLMLGSWFGRAKVSNYHLSKLFSFRFGIQGTRKDVQSKSSSMLLLIVYKVSWWIDAILFCLLYGLSFPYVQLFSILVWSLGVFIILSIIKMILFFGYYLPRDRPKIAILICLIMGLSIGYDLFTDKSISKYWKFKLFG